MGEVIPMWWDTRREPVQLALEIPIGPDSLSPKPPKVRKTCFIHIGAILLRILGLAVAVVTLAYGGWTFYQVTKYLYLEGIVKVVAQGGFLTFIGGLSLLAEARTRWTMRGCLSTYILFANYLARGLIYCLLGAIIFALKWYDPPYVQKPWVAGGILAVGVLNIAFYPFYWKHQRAVSISKAQGVALEPYPEEIIYGMDTLYIKKHLQQPTTIPSPAIGGLGRVEGANEVSPSFEEKDLEKETPGAWTPEVQIVVQPTTTSTTTSATSTTCAEQIRRSTTVTVDASGNVQALGIGAS